MPRCELTRYWAARMTCAGLGRLQYLRRMSKNREWGGHLELHALSTQLNVNVCVHQVRIAGCVSVLLAWRLTPCFTVGATSVGNERGPWCKNLAFVIS